MMKSNNVLNLFSFSVNDLITSCIFIASKLLILNPYISINSPTERSTNKPPNRTKIAYKLLTWRKIVSTYTPKTIGIVKIKKTMTIIVYFVFFSKINMPLNVSFKSIFKMKKLSVDNHFSNP